MTRIIFVRHGQTQENKLGLIQGATASKLNEFGRIQAAAAARALKAYKPTALYSSTFLRAMQTAQIVAEELGLPIMENALLREQSLGDWEGISWEQIFTADPTLAERRHREGWSFCPPGGEPRLQVRDRMLAFVDEARSELPGETVVAISHGRAIYYLIHALIDRVPIGSSVVQLYNAGLTIVDATERDVVLVTLNEIQHLQGLQEQ